MNSYIDIAAISYAGLMISLIFAALFTAMFIHELGHYIAARLSGQSIKSVSIGRGRVLKTWTNKRGVIWQLCLWPLGAHVQLGSMERASAQGENAFFQSTYPRRMMVILAGPFINIITPFFIFPLFYLAIGQPSAKPIIAGIEEGLPAHTAGLQPADHILAYNGGPTRTMKDLWDAAYINGAQKGTFTVKRGDQIFDVEITPEWTVYEMDLVKRENARMGIGWHHTPYSLKSIRSVAGEDVQTVGQAREKLIENLGTTTKVGVKGPDNQPPLLFTVNLSKELNSALYDPEDDDYDKVYLGQYKYNYYQDYPVTQAISKGLGYARDMIGRVITLPFQLFPLDRDKTKEKYRVDNPDTALINVIYRFCYTLSIVSVVLAFINILPLPGLDGGYILIQTVERMRGGRPLSNKTKAKIFVAVFIIVYASISLANIGNVPRYIESRLEKIKDFGDQSRKEIRLSS